MAVKLEDMMKKVFTAKERAAIRRDARAIAKRHMALRELREAGSRTQVAMARKLGVKQVSFPGSKAAPIRACQPWRNTSMRWAAGST